jgi:hypothetical protein
MSADNNHNCNLVSLRQCAREMGVDRPTVTAWLKARLLQPIAVLGALMVPREQLVEFEQFARMGYFDRNRYSRDKRSGFVQTEFAFQP